MLHKYNTTLHEALSKTIKGLKVHFDRIDKGEGRDAVVKDIVQVIKDNLITDEVLPGNALLTKGKMLDEPEGIGEVGGFGMRGVKDIINKSLDERDVSKMDGLKEQQGEYVKSIVAGMEGIITGIKIIENAKDMNDKAIHDAKKAIVSGVFMFAAGAIIIALGGPMAASLPAVVAIGASSTVSLFSGTIMATRGFMEYMATSEQKLNVEGKELIEQSINDFERQVAEKLQLNRDNAERTL